MNSTHCNKNDPDELYLYGEMLYKGLKVRRNKPIAARYFKAAADKGNLNAMLKYARMLSKGDGIVQNKDESAKYFKMAKEKRIQNAKIYRPYKKNTAKSQIDRENNQPQLNDTVNNPEETIPVSDSNNILSDDSKPKLSTTNDQQNLIPNQIQTTSCLPPIHEKNQPKQETIQKQPQTTQLNEDTQKTTQSQLPPIHKNTQPKQETIQAEPQAKSHHETIQKQINQEKESLQKQPQTKHHKKSKHKQTIQNQEPIQNQKEIQNQKLIQNQEPIQIEQLIQSQESIQNQKEIQNQKLIQNQEPIQIEQLIQSQESIQNQEEIQDEQINQNQESIKDERINQDQELDQNQEETQNERINQDQELDQNQEPIQDEQKNQDQELDQNQEPIQETIQDQDSIQNHKTASNRPQLHKNIKSTQRKVDMAKTMTRLPQDYIPLHYDLYLHIIDNEEELFESSVTITFQQNHISNICYLNISRNVEISSIIQNGEHLKYIISHPFLLIFQYKSVDFSEYPITINYTAQPVLNESKGFISSNGSYLTFFEPNLARKLFPCFDEPNVRSTFQVTLRIPTNLVGISNMPVEKTTEYEGGEKEIIFKKTPAIPTYLLSICIGDFASIEEEMENGIPIKIYAMKGQENNFYDIIKVSNYAIDWIESNLKVKYELPHLQILFHSAFKKEMGNYGLITCSDKHDLQSCSFLMTVIREIIHQWFGGSVSVKWWNSIWLNVGFSSFLQYMIYQDYDTEINVWNIFVEKKAVKSFKYFGNGLICPPKDEANLKNRLLVDEKGGFVIKMFHDIVGENNFMKICSSWLNHYKNKVVEISDFYSLVNDVLNFDYSNFFNPWLKSIGFPTLFVDEIIDEKDENHIIGINIKQLSRNKDFYWFNVPILYELNGVKKKFDICIDKEITTKFLQFDWIIVNDDIQALCFVVYSNSLYQKLANLKHNKEISNYNNYLINASKKSLDQNGFVRSSVKSHQKTVEQQQQ